MERDGKTRVGKGKGKMGGTGQGMGWGTESERRKGGKGGEGLQPPNFNSWHRHCPCKL